MIILLLLAQLMTISVPRHINNIEPKQFMEWFNEAKVGDRLRYSAPAGDGCNTIYGSLEKVSETEVIDNGTYETTAVSCYHAPTPIKVK